MAAADGFDGVGRPQSEDQDTVSSVSGRGKVLMVTSVITARVPNDPASTLQRS